MKNLRKVWGDGVSQAGDGRYLVYKPGHPNSRMNGYVQRSIFIMSLKIGRPLREGETVHHIDGNIFNDSIKNLKLFSSREKHLAFHHRLLGHKKYKPSFRDPSEPVVIKKPKFFLKGNKELICEIAY
jgi:hypothetical protein